MLNFTILIFSVYIFKKFYYNHIEYYGQICKYRKIKDFTRWILSDKFIAKEYAKINNFDVAKTFQIVKYPHQINFDNLPNNYVIKPIDLCDSAGIYFVKNNKCIKTNKIIDKKNIIFQLTKLRAIIDQQYYMHDLMFDGKIPYQGYIVEELLLDNNCIPNDYKFYTFGGRIYFIAITYNRKTIDKQQTFDSVWLNRNWEPINISMIKNGYKYSKNIKKPDNYLEILNKVENISKKLNRHCRIDIYIIRNKIYLGEFTFFCGATLHTFICNFILGIIWLFNKDCYKFNDPNLNKLIPKYYNKI